MKRLAFAILAAIALMCVAAQCTPGAPVPPPPPVSQDASVPVSDDAGAAPTPDPISLELCIENFEALNPGLSRDQVVSIFCSSPTDLAPWFRQATVNGAH